MISLAALFYWWSMLLGIKGQGHKKTYWDDFLSVLLVICDILSILFILISHLQWFFFSPQNPKKCTCWFGTNGVKWQHTELECKRIFISAAVKCWYVDPKYLSYLICGNQERPSIFSLCYCFSFSVSFMEPFDITSKLKQLNKTDSPVTTEGGSVELLWLDMHHRGWCWMLQQHHSGMLKSSKRVTILMLMGFLTFALYLSWFSFIQMQPWIFNVHKDKGRLKSEAD